MNERNEAERVGRATLDAAEGGTKSDLGRGLAQGPRALTHPRPPSA